MGLRRRLSRLWDETTDGVLTGPGINVESVDTDYAFLVDHGVASRGVPSAESRPGHLPTTPVSKTELFSTADLSWTSQDIYWPAIVRVDDILDNPLGKYYLYYSEDHADGGVGVAYADSPTGPFTDYGSNPIIDFHAGQDETPHPVWDEANDRLIVYYHTTDVGNNQTTCAATSTDGLSFADQGAVIDVGSDVPGDGHTGYAKVHKIGETWLAHHLMGGGDYARFGVSYGDDPLNFTTDTTPISGSLAGFGNERRIDWYPSLIPAGGQMWGVMTESDWVSGTSSGGKRAVIAPLADERRLAGHPVEIVGPTETWETSDIDSPFAFVSDGRMFVYYNSGNSIGVADMGVVL